MRRGLLSRFAENNRANENESIKKEIEVKDDIIPFEFEGKSYFLADRDHVLIFDANMLLTHTLEKSDVLTSEIPLLQKVSELIATKDDPSVKLFIKRNGTFEKISFYNRFDAIFILKKLRRVAARPDENIEELFIEDDGALVEHHKISPQRRFVKSFIKNRKETDAVVKLTGIEDLLEAIISDSVNNHHENIDNEKIDKCIALLEELKNQDSDEE